MDVPHISITEVWRTEQPAADRVPMSAVLACLGGWRIPVYPGRPLEESIFDGRDIRITGVRATLA